MVTDVVEAGGQGMDDPNRATVGDHQDLIARVKAEHICEEVIHTGGEVLEGLGIVRPGALTGAPAPMRFGETFLDLRHRQPFPGAEPSLAKPRIEANLEAQLRSNDLRSLACPRQVARIENVDFSIQLLGERVRLLAAQVVQPRVGAALPAAVAVPIRFPVPNQEERGHAN